MKTIRDLLIRLIQGCGEVDDPVMVKICRRDKDNCVVEVAILPIHHIDSYDRICVEEQDIKWENYR